MAISREEIKKMLGENATDEQVSSILDVFHANEKTLKDENESLTNQLSKYSDYDEMKKKLDDIETAKLSEQERLQKEKEEIAKNLKESRMIKNTAKAKEILAGLNVSDNLISSLISEDEALTIANANELLTSLNTLKDEVAKKTKEELTTLNIKPNVNDKNLDDGVMTFDKFKEMSIEEQNKFAEEHPEEFEKL